MTPEYFYFAPQNTKKLIPNEGNIKGEKALRLENTIIKYIYVYETEYCPLYSMDHRHSYCWTERMFKATDDFRGEATLEPVI